MHPGPINMSDLKYYVMKKNILSLACLVIVTASFCQRAQPSHLLTREDYMTKSKRQKTAAWVLLAGGIALIGVGFLIGNRKESSFNDAATGAIIGGISALSVTGSTPLFIASGKNKRKGMSIAFKNEKAPQLFTRNFISRSIPSATVRIGL